jgi:hypothetical protein
MTPYRERREAGHYEDKPQTKTTSTKTQTTTSKTQQTSKS